MSKFIATYQAIAKVADPEKFLLAPFSITADEVSPAAVQSLPATIEVLSDSPQYDALTAAYAEHGLIGTRVALTLEEKEGKWVPSGAEVL